MNVTAAPHLVINGQTVSTSMVVVPGLTVSVTVLVGADPAFPRTYRKMVDFDPIGDTLIQGAELGIAVPFAGFMDADMCDCHGLVWPADMLTFSDDTQVFECPLSLDINPLPASFQRQAMR